MYIEQWQMGSIKRYVCSSYNIKHLYYLVTGRVKPTHSRVKKREYGSAVIISGSVCTFIGLGHPLLRLRLVLSKVQVLKIQVAVECYGFETYSESPIHYLGSTQLSVIEEWNCCETWSGIAFMGRTVLWRTMEWCSTPKYSAKCHLYPWYQMARLAFDMPDCTGLLMVAYILRIECSHCIIATNYINWCVA